MPNFALALDGAPPPPDAAPPEPRRFAGASLEASRARMDKVLGGLLLLQWAVAGVLAWRLHARATAFPDTGTSIVAVLAAIPMLMLCILAWVRPGASLTRHTAAASQVLMSCLLLHLGGGRPELAFHVFCSLALVTFYMDAAVVMFAAVLATAQGALDSFAWAGSGGVWHWLAQSVWVFIAALILRYLIRQTLTTQSALAEYASEQASLSRQAIEREEHARKLDALNRELIESSREAGMAEIATSVLHNVGNILNSVNTSSVLISDRARRTKAGELGRIAALLKQNEPHLAEFLTSDPRGRMLPQLIEHLADALLVEQGELIAEAEGLAKNVGHIRDIVAMQQSYASVSGLRESVAASALLDDAVQINADELDRLGVRIVREFEDIPPLMVDKSKLMQILVNLIKNAWQSIAERRPEVGLLTLGIAPDEEDSVRISIRDNGVGIPFENLTRIFSHGFTTKRNGHGFGLHGGALLAKEMGGSLTAQSHGPGRGATFTLKLPLAEDAGVRATA